MSEGLLKRDAFGTVSLVQDAGDGCLRVCRDTRAAHWALRPLARALARREARALVRLAGLAGVPRLESWSHGVLMRSYIAGEPMHRAQPRDARYFASALRLVRALHARGVLHNDLAKETNWLVTPDCRAAVVDFQLATTGVKRGALFRALARDDVRHLLKHKRTYLPERLTERDQRLLAAPSWIARGWMRTGKPIYLLVTRRLFGWADREGAGDRHSAAH